jgi:hypothetical protein
VGSDGPVTDERPNPEQDDVTLAEIELESDLMDADVEGLGRAERSAAVPAEPVHEAAKLDDNDLAEAEAEADVMDADVEGS